MGWHKKTYRDYLGFNDIPLLILGIPVLGLLMPLMFLGFSWEEGWSCFASNAPAAILHTGLFWIGDRTITVFFRKKFPEYRDVRKRLIMSATTVIVYTVAIMLLMGVIQHASGLELFDPKHKVPLWRSIAGSLIATSLVLSIYESIYFINRWKHSLIETEKLRQEQAEGQLEILRNQVNPHFLFNSLNTLSSLIPEDPAKAVEFVQRLSLVYRRILDLNEKPVATLREEWECVEHYLFLLKTRFDESLSFEVRLNDSVLNKYVVPFCIQMLVENAIKHNIVSRKRPLMVSIWDKDDRLFVSNNLQPKQEVEPSSGTGLMNIDSRFKLLFDKEILVEKTQTDFTVSLPLMQIETK